MNYRIEHKEAFRIVGAKRHYCLDIAQSMEQVPLFWGEAAANGTFETLCALPAKEPCGILGVCACMNGKDFDYYIARAADAPDIEVYSQGDMSAADYRCEVWLPIIKK